MADENDQGSQELGQDDMWATEYHETYTTPLCGREYEPHDDEGTSAIRAYPRLVQRDGSSRVVLKDAEKRSRGFCASTVRDAGGAPSGTMMWCGVGGRHISHNDIVALVEILLCLHHVLCECPPT